MYLVELRAIIRSDDIDELVLEEKDREKPWLISSHERHYIKTTDLPIPPSIGISVDSLYSNKIESISIIRGKVICRLEDWIIRLDEFKEAISQIGPDLIEDGWTEDVRQRLPHPLE